MNTTKLCISFRDIYNP